jgi:hypothetical protein
MLKKEFFTKAKQKHVTNEQSSSKHISSIFILKARIFFNARERSTDPSTATDVNSKNFPVKNLQVTHAGNAK